MNKLVGIHYEPQKQFYKDLKIYEEILKFNGLRSVRLCASCPGFWDQVKQLDLFIYYWGQWDAAHQNAKAIIPIVEKELNIPCFPNTRTCWAYDDKIRQYYLMQSHGFPMAKCWVFWEEDEAVKWAQDAPLPVVFKLSGGAGSKNVILIKDKKSLLRIIEIMFHKGIQDGRLPGRGSLAPRFFARIKRYLALKKRYVFSQPIPQYLSCPNWKPHKHYVLFQEFLPDNKYDTRVFTVGDRAYALRRSNRPGDFRASGSHIEDNDPTKIDLRMVEKALEISRKMGFQAMNYDFLYTPDKRIKFTEISYATAQWEFYRDQPGYWDSDLNWHQGHYWPQYFELMDALNLPDLRQPDGLL